MVKGDHAPHFGVAQGVTHGVGHHGQKEEEVEGEVRQEVERNKGEDSNQTTRCMCMDGMK